MSIPTTLDDPRLVDAKLHVGDRLAAFSALLPGRPPGVVLLAVSDPLRAALTRRFPGALGLTDAEAVPAASVELLIVDTRVAAPTAFEALLAPDAVVASIGRRGTYAIYPDIEHPQQVWRRGWPLPAMVGPVAEVKRLAGLWGGIRRRVPHLTITGPSFESLADAICSRLAAEVGEPLALVGLISAGHTVLRFRGAHDYAVRLSWTSPDGDMLRGSTVARAVPAVAGLVVPEVARGQVWGYPWAASLWIPQRRRPLRDSWREEARSWAAAERLAGALATVRTGRTGPGWARRWCAASPLLPAGAVPALEAALAPLERGLATGWCHGDPWSGNVLLDPSGPRVIDWDNAAPDAPVGLDWLLIAALQRSDRRVSLAAACTELVTRPGLVRQPIAGRRWADWPHEDRIALAVAAIVLYLRNRVVHDLGADNLQRTIDGALALCRLRAEAAAADSADDSDADDSDSDARDADDSAGDSFLPWEEDDDQNAAGVSVPPAPADPPTAALPDAPSSDHDAMSRRVTRGAWWLGAGAAVSKGSATLVLLVLAVLLAPSALGVLAVGALVVNICSAVTDLGSSTALVYWRGDAERAARSALAVALALSLVLTTLCWLLAPELAAALRTGDEGADVIRGLTATLPFLAVAGVSGEMLRRELRFARRVLPDIAGAGVGAGVSLVLAFQGHGVAALVVGQIVQAVLTMVALWLVRRPIRPGWNRQDVRGLLAYGGHLAGANLVLLVLLNVDYVIVARMLGEHALGEYSLAFRLAYLPFINVAVVCCGAAFPYLCRLRGPELGRAAMDTAVRTMTLVVPLYLGMVLFASQLELLGEKWRPAVPVVRWLAVYGLLLSIVKVCQTVLNAIGRPSDTLLLCGLHLVALVGLLALVTRRGIVAVAIAQAAAAGAVLVVALAVTARRLLGVVLPRLAGALLPCVLGCVAMLAVATLEHSVAVPSLAPGSVLIAGAAALAAYAGTVWALRRRVLPFASGSTS